jgi:hypothetical protein
MAVLIMATNQMAKVTLTATMGRLPQRAWLETAAYHNGHCSQLLDVATPSSDYNS